MWETVLHVRALCDSVCRLLTPQVEKYRGQSFIMDDDLGDLGDIMGEDYAHGYDDAEGDPNVKPKVRLTPCCCACRTAAWIVWLTRQGLAAGSVGAPTRARVCFWLEKILRRLLFVALRPA